MSLPPATRARRARYVSARLRTSDTQAELTYDSGVQIEYLATGAETMGDFGLYRYTFGPKQGGPGPQLRTD